MKKKLLSILLFIVITFQTFQVSATGSLNNSMHREIPQNLYINSSDPKVLEAQQWLNQNYTGKYTYVPITEDGKTGAATVKALTVALQIELGLGNNSTGTFGPTTTSLCPTLSKTNPGSNSNIVRILQHALFCKGYGTYDDYDTFGPDTEAAVKNIENDAGLNQTGIVTPMIFKAILNTDPLKLNINGDSKIRVIQQSLNKNYNQYFGIMPTDGIYGANTNKALIYGLQAEEGLSTSVANGNFGPTTTSLCPDLLYGDTKANYVKLLQYVLYCNGYDPGAFDGVYGDAVKSAVTSFQQLMCLNVTGNADRGTQMSLYTTCGDTARAAAACDTATRLNAETVQTIKDAGYTYVGRYLTNANTGVDKKMTADEIQLILNAGLSIFPIYQTYGGSKDYYTVEQAKTDAASAENAAKNFGFPKDTTLYFAVDYDAYDYEVTDNILPYFQQLYETMQTLGVVYNIGVYAPRNVCNRVYDAGYAKYCFVSDASSGYSGNLGYRMPMKWSFDQFKTDISIGSGTGTISIDKVAYSGKDKAVSSLDENLLPSATSSPSPAPESPTPIPTIKSTPIVTLKTFPDVNSGSFGWAQASVEFLAGLNIISGSMVDGQLMYLPGNTITRAELCKLIVAAYGFTQEGQATSFTDMGTHWAIAYVAIASSQGIVKGYEDSTFKPNLGISREELAIMISRAMRKKNIGSLIPEEQVNEKLSAFLDQAGIHDWARNDVAYAVENGIIKGSPAEGGGFNFLPLNTANRAETAVMIKRAYDKLN